MRIKWKEITEALHYKKRHIREKISTYWVLEKEGEYYYLKQYIKIYWFIILYIPCLILTFLFYGIAGIKEDFPMKREIASWYISKNNNIHAYNYFRTKQYIKD